VPEDFNFQNTVYNMRGEEKTRFIQFPKRIIKWRPEDRSTANELLTHPWLYTKFPQDE